MAKRKRISVSNGSNKRFKQNDSISIDNINNAAIIARIYPYLTFDTKRAFRLVCGFSCKIIDNSMIKEADGIGKKYQENYYNQHCFRSKPFAKSQLRLIGLASLGYGHLIYFNNQRHIWKTIDYAAIHGRTTVIMKIIKSFKDPKLKIRTINRSIWQALQFYQYYTIKKLMDKYGNYKGLCLGVFMKKCIDNKIDGINVQSDKVLVKRSFSTLKNVSKRDKVFSIFLNNCGPVFKNHISMFNKSSAVLLGVNRRLRNSWFKILPNCRK